MVMMLIKITITIMMMMMMIIIIIMITIIIIIMSVFLERLFMWSMLYCAEQVQIQKYKTHAYKTPKTASVQTIMLKHPTKHLQKERENTYKPKYRINVHMFVSLVSTRKEAR